VAELLSPALFWLILSSCASVPFNRKYVGAVFETEGSAGVEESFPDLWGKWTVHLGLVGGGPKPWQLMNPLSAGGGRGGPGGGFPLQIAATLMDTTLIEAGLKHYETTLGMSPEERAEFRRAYFQRYDVEDHLLIWCELRTSWAELHLDLDRWIIFIEDDAMNQYEPVRVSEEPGPLEPAVTEIPVGERVDRSYTGWVARRKNVMLLFPNQDFLENPVLSPRTKSLKLVFMLRQDDQTRAEGVWVFRQ
jgi:hypothetical protein